VRCVKVEVYVNVESVFVMPSVNWNPTSATLETSVNVVTTTVTTSKVNRVEVSKLNLFNCVTFDEDQ
jgi:hypothetical protein